jgi:hypothetical protein
MITHGLILVMLLAAVQLSPRMTSLTDALRPVLPYPSSTPAGDLPADNSAASKWFVVWPTEPDEHRVVVRANPLHPEVQETGAKAMTEINKAVAAAERRARESYDRALERLRKTGKSGELDTITLEDEGVAGERIDAELEAIVELLDVAAFDIDSSEAPTVGAGSNGPTWVVRIPANTYQSEQGGDKREHFRAAETRLYFGIPTAPTVTRGEAPRFRVSVTPVANAFSVVIRGNALLVSQIETAADWSRLASR